MLCYAAPCTACLTSLYRATPGPAPLCLPSLAVPLPAPHPRPCLASLTSQIPALPRQAALCLPYLALLRWAWPGLASSWPRSASLTLLGYASPCHASPALPSYSASIPAHPPPACLTSLGSPKPRKARPVRASPALPCTHALGRAEPRRALPALPCTHKPHIAMPSKAVPAFDL